MAWYRNQRKMPNFRVQDVFVTAWKGHFERDWVVLAGRPLQQPQSCCSMHRQSGYGLCGDAWVDGQAACACLSVPAGLRNIPHVSQFVVHLAQLGTACSWQAQSCM